MKLKNNAYPYPVLRKNSDDYLKGTIDLEVEINQIMNVVNLEVRFELEEKSLEELIHSGKAKKIVHIECPQTLYRKIFEVEGTEKYIPLDQNKLRGRVEVTGFIVAVTDIKYYKSDNFNLLYGNLSFNFEQGNILAEASMYEINLFESEKSLEKISSIIKVVSSRENEFMTVETSPDKIVIALPKKQYAKYTIYSKTSFNNIFISMIIVPTLVEVLNKIRYEQHNFEDDRWFISMKNTLKSLNIELENTNKSSLEIAQILLKNPIQGSINILNKIEESETD